MSSLDARQGATRRTSDHTTRPIRVAMASFIGTAVEWYDYFIYGMAAALVFGPQFFPGFSPLAGTLASFATFSVGFLARPIGGVVMGHFGDRVGRKSMLVTSLMLMGLATVGIGLLPNYATIGVWAPILLVLLRLLQGVGVGGEWGGAVLMAVEHAPPRRRTFYGSFPQMGVPGGFVLASLVYLVMTASLSTETMSSWGWRVPFLASAILLAVGLVIRLSISESPAFQEVKAAGRQERLPVLTVLRKNLKQVLVAAGAFAGNNALGYIFMAYLLSYTTTVLELDRGMILAFIVAGSAVWLVVTPIACLLCDRYGKRPVLLAGSAGQVVWAVALFPFVNTASPALILVAIIGLAVCLAIVYGPLAVLFAELFSAEVRYSGASLGYQVGSILGGGLAPTVATALYVTWNSTAPISAYLTVMAVACLGCLAYLTRPRRS
ncbi:metabolite-proton symporter [Prauserella shujinwangii]|uniref:Putative proline/betaine transporter n=1 Tax=Prauserella shujinwangii TaxID=1453103 RepID=A0A2T0M3U7_9PSEU|nr:MFS transporter [Prauserella shujinwangii]PRX51400.1 metabolite-proton symporter [Prauserella shujinwangii]